MTRVNWNCRKMFAWFPKTTMGGEKFDQMCWHRSHDRQSCAALCHQRRVRYRSCAFLIATKHVSLKRVLRLWNFWILR